MRDFNVQEVRNLLWEREHRKEVRAINLLKIAVIVQIIIVTILIWKVAL